MALFCHSLILSLQDTELEPIMAKRKVEVEEWSPLLIPMDELLYNSSGLLNFSNLDVRTAVKYR